MTCVMCKLVQPGRSVNFFVNLVLYVWLLRDRICRARWWSFVAAAFRGRDRMRSRGAAVAFNAKGS